MRIHVILPGELVVKMDATARQLEAAAPGSTISRVDIVRRALHVFLASAGK